MFLPFACLQSRLHVGNVKVFHHLELSYSGSFGLWPQWLLCLVAFQAKAEDSERNPRESICVLAWWNEFWGIQSWPMRIHELGNSWEPQSPILLIRKYFRWVSHPSHHNDGVWFIPRYLHGIFFFYCPDANTWLLSTSANLFRNYFYPAPVFPPTSLHWPLSIKLQVSQLFLLYFTHHPQWKLSYKYLATAMPGPEFWAVLIHRESD